MTSFRLSQTEFDLNIRTKRERNGISFENNVTLTAGAYINFASTTGLWAYPHKLD